MKKAFVIPPANNFSIRVLLHYFLCLNYLSDILLCYFPMCYLPRKKQNAIFLSALACPNFVTMIPSFFCGKNMELDICMFTLVNYVDPIPWLLMSIRMNVTKNKEFVDRTIEEKLSSCLERLDACLNPLNLRKR